MAICPHCQTREGELHQPCPAGDGYFLVSEDAHFGHASDPWLGRRLGDRFIISSILGTGSMGHVYKAYQEQVDRMVAIKIFESGEMGPSQSQEGPDDRDRFIQEARVLAKLSHPNCVTLYDFGYNETEDFLYIAMEHVGGISLRRAVRRGVKFAALVEVVRQVLMALREAHALEIVHRDLKPENIILSYRKTSDEQIVKVLDFGIAKLLRKEPGEMTQAGLLFGTPAYMSPEQCRGETDVTPASDIYSLGCLIFEMATGHLPFEADLPQEMVRQHQFEPVPPMVPRQGTEFPEGFEDFVVTCLAKEPEERFAHARAALARFEAIVGGESNAPLTHGLANLGGETGSLRVAVPETKLTGAKLDPTGELESSEALAAASALQESASIQVDSGTEKKGADLREREQKKRGSVTKTARNIAAANHSGAKIGSQTIREQLSGRTALVAAAVLMVILFCSLLFTYMYLVLSS